MSATADRELKLGADADFTLPEFPGEPLAERTFTSTYHDTADMRLARAGIILAAGSSAMRFVAAEAASRPAAGRARPAR